MSTTEAPGKKLAWIALPVVLAGLPARHAGSAGGVLSTVNQIGGAVGIAVLGTVFFAALDTPAGASRIQVYGHAFARVLPAEAALYLLTAGLMLLLPRTTQPQSTVDLKTVDRSKEPTSVW